MTRGWKLLLPLSLLLTLPVSSLGQNPRKPVYVGVRVCAGCHSGPGMGNQYSKWLHSRHSQAWAVLAKPESQKIAAISGLRQNPQETFTCLGCHSSGAQAEAWEKDDTFNIRDGVQCETCHGPGSEYASVEVMRNREAAMKAGLMMPSPDTCENCHMVKGSHTAVLKVPKLDIKQAIEQIAHPTPENAVMGSLPQPADGALNSKTPRYVGSQVCGTCHSGRHSGYQFSVWRMSDHARAWSVLGLEKAVEIARKKGLEGDPQRLPECLKCHSTGFAGGPEGKAASFSIDEGVGCEACHGPGSEYMDEAVMRDRRTAQAAGLKPVGPATCNSCHADAHDKPFEKRMETIAHPTRLPETANEPIYKSPRNMALSPDGSELYVTCYSSDSVAVVDAASRGLVAEISVGRHPEDVTFTPDGRRAFVSNMFDDTVSVIDVEGRKVTDTLTVGDEPHGLLTDRDGKFLYVLNASSEDITVIDTQTLQRVKNLSASRRPWSLALSPDGGRIAVTHALSRLVGHRERLLTEVTVIETGRGVVEDRWIARDANLMMGVAWHPSGEYALSTVNRTKSLVPMTRLMQGWTINNGLAVIWSDGAINQLLLDEPNLGFADPTDVAITPDGRYALITSAGTDRVAVADLKKLTAIVRSASPEERERVLPNHRGQAAQFVVKVIPVLNNPRGIVISPDGRTAFVANTLDDSLSVIDLERMELAGRIHLGVANQISKARFGERLFHNAKITFQRQYSCYTCHPDGHIDGITYDIEADGIGVSPVDNRTLRGILDTAPFKWEGTNPSLSRQCGARLAVFFTRLAPFNPEELEAVDRFVTTIVRPPNRYRPLGADLTPAQRRGKEIFERTMTNDQRMIPVGNRCITCHYPPYYTDRRRHDIGTRDVLDRQGSFDTPHLNNIYDSAPYLHNGMALSLEEIWTVYNPDDKHGVTNDMTKDQLNDLIEYLKTL